MSWIIIITVAVCVHVFVSSILALFLYQEKFHRVFSLVKSTFVSERAVITSPE